MSEAMVLADRAHRAGDLEAAEDLYRRCLHDYPADARHRLALVLSGLGEPGEIETLLREAVEADPAFPQARHSLALHLLSLGRYAEGWPLYEARREIPALTAALPPLPFPEWRGEPLAGKRIVAFGEQGFGDQIMFARFLPALFTLGAEVTYAVSPELLALFPGSVPLLGPWTIRRPDYWALVGSLPLHLGVTLETLPAPFPLARDGRGGGVGVVVAGNPRHGHDAIRSLRGDDAGALRALGRHLGPDATGARDFGETASIIAALDLVISVDTAVAHLAASMGKPTWVLLPSRHTDWRWLRDRSDSPWYPSVTLYRQEAPFDWSAVLQRVTAGAQALTEKM